MIIDVTTEKQLQGCKINLANYEDWRFVYGYESNGKDVYLMVTLVDDDDGIEFYLNGNPIGLTTDDFKDCQDIDDCSLAIAKHLIKDNDGEVLTTFVNHHCHTLTGIYYEKKLSKDLEYINGDLEDESWQVTLFVSKYLNVNCYDYIDIPTDDLNRVLEMISTRDLEELGGYMFGRDYTSNEVLNLWGEEWLERLSFDVRNEKSDTVMDGSISVATNNIFDYNDDVHYTIVDDNNHPDYVLIHQDEIKRSYATFRVPKDFNIGEIHFVDRYIIPKNYMLDGEIFGDYMTTIGVFKYRGELYYSDDYGDSDNWGEQYIGLFKWDEENRRYELIAETK